jgi:hypothetical protein
MKPEGFADDRGWGRVWLSMEHSGWCHSPAQGQAGGGEATQRSLSLQSGDLPDP